MTQRKAYKYVLVPDGFGPKSGALFLALKRIPVSGSDFPESPRRGNRIRTQNLKNALDRWKVETETAFPVQKS